MHSVPRPNVDLILNCINWIQLKIEGKLNKKPMEAQKRTQEVGATHKSPGTAMNETLKRNKKNGAN